MLKINMGIFTYLFYRCDANRFAVCFTIQYHYT